MKVCFVGVGSIGKRHIKNFVQVCKENNTELVIHAYRTSDKPLDREIASYIQKNIFEEKQLEDEYDAVFITNPTYKHYETIEKFFSKTNVFFVEKPVFDSNDKDISNFLGHGKEFYVACPLRYTNVLIKAKEIIEQEKVFSVRAISSSYLPDWRKGVDYRETYSAHKSQGGGVKIDLIHEWDYLYSMFGKPKRVYNLSGKYSRLEIDSEDLAVYIAEYEDKLLELHLDYFGRKTRRSLELRTAENEYIFDIVESKIYKNGIMAYEFNEDANEKYMKEMEFFYNMILKKECSTNDLQQALETMKITEEESGSSKYVR